MKKTETELESWAALLKTYNRTIKKIKADLKAEDLPGLDVYDVLWTLERESKDMLRLIELADKMDLEKYSVTRLIDRMVSDKLIVKHSCDMDKRGQFAMITDKGRKLRQKMWTVYRKSIQEHFGKKLSHETSEKLYSILQESFLSES